MVWVTRFGTAEYLTQGNLCKAHIALREVWMTKLVVNNSLPVKPNIDIKRTEQLCGGWEKQLSNIGPNNILVSGTHNTEQIQFLSMSNYPCVVISISL